MVRALVRIVAHWIAPIVNHNISYWVVMIHQITILHGLSTLRGY